MTSDRARRRRRLVQQKRHRHIAPAAQTFRVNPFRLMPVSTTIDHVVDYGVQIKLFAINFIRHARQVLGLHQLKLMPYRRNHTLVPLFRLIDKAAVAVLHLLLDNATPAKAMIGQLAIPLIVVVRNFSFREDLLRRLSFRPCFRAGELIRIALWLTDRSRR